IKTTAPVNPINPTAPTEPTGRARPATAECHRCAMPRLEEGIARTAAGNSALSQAGQRMEEFHARLKERGLKSTGQRDDIARVFFALGRHISAEELYAEVKKVNPHVGYATIYRTLR